MTGIVIVDKPQGWTSQDVAAKLRGIFHEKHVGHGGTLDPMATGVLPVFLGRATRAVPFFEHAEKEYLVGIRFGVRTTTQDITGTVLEEREPAVTEEGFRATLQAMEGPQLQVPPMYSAIKINGKKLYELAREGKEVERKPREVVLKELELLEFSGSEAVFRLLCSKGTYARTVCEDLGAALGCGACMCSLRRSKAGSYTLAQAFTMEQLQAGEATVLPVDSMFAGLETVTLTEGQERFCRNGNPVTGLQLAEGTQYRVYSQKGEFLMLRQYEAGLLKTVRSFFEV